MTLDIFSIKKKTKEETLKEMQKVIDLQLRTFTNQLRQISTSYESIQNDLNEVKKTLKDMEKKK